MPTLSSDRLLIFFNVPILPILSNSGALITESSSIAAFSSSNTDKAGIYSGNTIRPNDEALAHSISVMPPHPERSMYSTPEPETHTRSILLSYPRSILLTVDDAVSVKDRSEGNRRRSLKLPAFMPLNASSKDVTPAISSSDIPPSPSAS